LVQIYPFTQATLKANSLLSQHPTTPQREGGRVLIDIIGRAPR